MDTNLKNYLKKITNCICFEKKNNKKSINTVIFHIKSINLITFDKTLIFSLFILHKLQN